MRNVIVKCLLLVLFVTLIGPLEHIVPSPKTKAEFDEGGIRANTVYGEERLQLDPLMSARLDGMTPAYEHENTFISNVLVADFPFDAVGVEWEEFKPEGTTIDMAVRFESLTGEWSDWAELLTENQENQSEIVTTERSQSIQYKVDLKSETGDVTPRVYDVKFHYIDASAEVPEEVTPEPTPEPLTRLTFGGSLDVISRSEWGADESWRLASYFGVEEDEGIEDVDVETEDTGRNGAEPTIRDLYPEEFELTSTITEDSNGNDYYWPMEYAENVDKIVIHHTAGTNGDEDPEAAIRAIYYYHSVRKGWGDIGYNYLIDVHGNIYEGRAGGDSIVAGHARGNNTGTIGIAVMGNYENDNVPYEALESLAALVQEKAELHNINVDGFSQFRGEVTPNLGGHRDFGSTLCPGKNLYAALPTLRKVIDGNLIDLEGQLLDEGSDDPYAFANSNSYDPLVLDPEETEAFTLKLKNIGTETWNSDTYLVANKNSNAEALVHLIKDEENSKSVAFMEETTVAPGQTATFTIQAESMLRGGFESFDLTPIFNGVTKTSHYLNLPVYVAAPLITYDLIDLDIDQDRMETGAAISGELTIKNTGNVNWYKEGTYPVKLTIERTGQTIELLEPTVAPGQTGTFMIEMNASNDPGRYIEVLVPVLSGVEALEGESIMFEVLAYNSDIQAVYMGASTETTFSPGEQKEVWMDMENTGYLTWGSGDNDFQVGVIRHPSIGVTTPILEDTAVDPGETGRMTFRITAPDDPGTYIIYFRPRLNRQNLTQKPFYFRFTVMDFPEGTSTSTFTTTTSNADLDQESIRIKLGFDDDAFGAPTITADGDFNVYLGDDLFFDLEEGDEVEVKQRDDRYQVTYDAYAWIVDEPLRFIAASNSVLEITNYENRPAWNTSLNDNRFRGILEVQIVDDELAVINELPMEMYLRGVAESLNSDPVEKIKTMVIVARSYARYYLTEEEKFPGKPYHLDDDPDVSQKYLGYGFEVRADNIVQAVEDTAGMVITYGGKIIKTPYFSSTDGTSTRSAEEVWGWTHTPYLVSVPDPLCEATAFSGHGVGLSGCGTTAAAEAGKTFEEIIKYYYTGVEIEVK